MYFENKEDNAVTFSHSAQQKYASLGEIESKSKKLSPKKKVALELLHHSLGRISNISLMDRDTDYV